MSNERKYFEVKSCLSANKQEHHEFFRIISIAGGDTVAYGIPSRDMAEAACEAFNQLRSKKK